MNDIERAIRILADEECTCVICRGNDTYKSHRRGVAPMLEYISKGVGFSGGSAADKVIGKAAAILFVYARISAVYGHVISRGAADVFDKYGITYSYGTITDHIVNRSGTGICPMEEAVKNTDNLNAAYNAICHRYEQLRKEGK